MLESRIAIIPARSGSKRIPRKNIKAFLGKPIIAYSIEVALASGLFDEVMVSTDDEEIGSIAREFGANVPFIRSEKNSNDLASTMDVIKEVMQFYVSSGKSFSYGCCIYATAPFILAEHLAKGFDKLINSNLDTVFPVVPFSYPIWRGLESLHDGKVKMVWPEYQNSRSQDLKPVFHDAGQWYWFNLKTPIEALFTSNSGSLILSEEEVQDIDTITDWKLAEMKYKLLHEA
ncbi:MAG TPA: pseudaminic acid cytidylyltransferase [Ohtaekwangia sp.]|nr:pseudaminic acid cytidylyltransferase [Ohtaekwangia sp.]